MCIRDRDGVVIEVSFINAPALVLNRNVTVQTKDYGQLTVDISWGGNVYAILPAAAVGIEIDPGNAGKLVESANSIAGDINAQVTIKHPELDFVDRVTHVEFSGPPKGAGADIQNCVVALPKVCLLYTSRLFRPYISLSLHPHFQLQTAHTYQPVQYRCHT